MAWIPSKSVRLLGDLERRVDEAFAQLIHGPWRSPSGAIGWEPAIDVHETHNDYFVLVDIPGVMPEEVRVYVEDQTLVVHGRRASQQLAKAGAVIYAERFQGEFVRRFPLPGDVDPANLQVSFARGLLIIQLPKPRAKA
jgi:HSP20 family protein